MFKLSLFAAALATVAMASPLASAATTLVQTQQTQSQNLARQLLTATAPTKPKVVCAPRLDPITHENLGVICRPAS
jgi:hypothetical protein